MVCETMRTTRPFVDCDVSHAIKSPDPWVFSPSQLPQHAIYEQTIRLFTETFVHIKRMIVSFSDDLSVTLIKVQGDRQYSLECATRQKFVSVSIEQVKFKFMFFIDVNVNRIQMKEMKENVTHECIMILLSQIVN